MAKTLNLANYNRTTVIDLINGVFKVDPYSWVTGTTDARIRYDYTTFGAQPTFEYYQPVAEVFNLSSCIGGAAALRALHEIQDVMEGVRRYHDGTPTVESWWLEWNGEDEEPKRALIYTMTLDFPTTRDVISPTNDCYGTGIKMALTRHPLWETKTIAEIDDASVLVHGGIMALGTVDGTVPARMDEVIIIPAVNPTQSLIEHWVGIRPTHNGTAGFTPVWECEDGTNGTNAADAVDITASDGNKVTVTPGTTTLVERLSISLNQIEPDAADFPDYIGRYLVLLRCKVSAGTWGLQMRSGYNDELIHEEVYIDSTNWSLHELGEISIPPWANYFFAKTDFVGSFEITLYGERVSGVGTLDLDCLILIPSEHFLYVGGTNMSTTAHQLHIHTLENDTTASYQYRPAVTSLDRAAEHIPRLWYIPVESGILVYAAQGAGVHVLTDTVEFEINYHPRWLAHRYD